MAPPTWRSTRRCGEGVRSGRRRRPFASSRSEEHTSELQSLRHLVCRLPLEKKNNLARSRVWGRLLQTQCEQEGDRQRWLQSRRSGDSSRSEDGHAIHALSVVLGLLNWKCWR